MLLLLSIEIVWYGNSCLISWLQAVVVFEELFVSGSAPIERPESSLRQRDANRVFFREQLFWTVKRITDEITIQSLCRNRLSDYQKTKFVRIIFKKNDGIISGFASLLISPHSIRSYSDMLFMRSASY